MWPVSWAPDGQHLLFVVNSQATGNDVMVLPLGGDRRPYPFARIEVAEHWAAFSPDGGSQARWRRDGREIFYIGADRSLMVTAVNGEGTTFEIGEMQRLFEPRFFFLDSHGFDLAADGQRILVNTLIVSPATPAAVAE